ncbi:MAG: hypothetical protein AABX38_07850 [Candidatus Micrarchaeota archaeon]
MAKQEKAELDRIFEYTNQFYNANKNMLVLFSIPFILASLIPLLVSAPTYITLGGTYIRTGSFPDFSVLDVLFTVVAYAVSVFLIADTIVNINLIVKSKRTMLKTPYDILKKGASEYVLRIFLVLTLLVLLTAALQLLTYDLSIQKFVYPLLTFLVYFFTFFFAQAVIIDDSDTASAIYRSISLATKKWYLVLLWTFIGLVGLSITKFLGDLLFGGFSEFFVLLVNSLVILPYLIVLQVQIYMEKYPLSLHEYK